MKEYRIPVLTGGSEQVITDMRPGVCLRFRSVVLQRSAAVLP
jgi:hypothetical protein